MIIVRGVYFRLDHPMEAEAILFIDRGDYCYVESGILENELRVLRNWGTAERSDNPMWGIEWLQGTVIPQELGDWLVAHQDNNQTPNKTEQTKNQTED